MLVLAVVQFPIADGRVFCGVQRQPKPVWGSLTEGADFLQGFGGAKVQAEFDAVPSVWRDDAQYMSARWALRTRGRIERLEIDGVDRPPARGQPFFAHRPQAPATDCRFTPAFRRLLCDGEGAARVDVGFWVLGREGIGETDVLKLAHDLLEIEIEVPDLNGKAERRPLRRQGNALARLMVQSTSRRPANGQPWPDRPSIVRAAPPAVFLDDRTGVAQMPRRPPWFRAVAAKAKTPLIESFPSRATVVPEEATGNLRLAYTTLEMRDARHGVWMIRGLAQGGPETVPGLRAALLRLHATRQVLRELQWLAARGDIPCGKDDGTTDAFDGYLKKLVGQVLRPTSRGTDQAQLRRILSLYDLGDGGLAHDQLLIAFDRLPLNRQVKSRIRQATAVTIDGGNVVIYQAGSVDMSTNQTTNVSNTGSGSISIGEINQVAGDYIRKSREIAASASQENLKQALTALAQQVDALTKKTSDPAAQEAAARKLKQLTEEAAAPKPDKDFLKVTGKGLVEAAKAVAEMAAPIATAVGTVLGIFGIAL
jgi:hypothetical protein